MSDEVVATCPDCGRTQSAGACRHCRPDRARYGETIGTDPLAAILAGPVLESLAASIGPVPHVLLPDTSDGTMGQPPVNPASSEMPPIADRPTCVQLLGEIARGGMGVVFKGRDPDLGRDLAVKVLLETHKEKPDLVRRFVEEAQIGGQLQHPGVVPVYELGTFGDRRPYFTMKLVKGQTLAELLAGRESPVGDLPRFLGIFEQVCQTVAYAHARDVIHRDLKPSNVMVGAFGEVQVMDWGLAKVMARGGVVDDVVAGKIPAHDTVIATARVGSDSDLSQAGSVLGTPAYMAPEQARGEIDFVDERADVFALGSILCEVLTGRPAFTGRSAGEIHRKAALGDLAESLAALERSGADVEVIALARDCLAREAEDRPRHAGAVAERITASLNGVQEKLRSTEIARATEEARAEEEAKRRVLADELAREAQARAEGSRRTAEAAEARSKAERRARRLTGALAASVLGLMVAVGGGYAWFAQQRAERQARVDLALREAEVLRGAAEQAGSDLARWRAAREAAHAVERLLADARDLPTRRLVAALVESVTAAARTAEDEQRLLEKLIDIRSATEDDPDWSATDAAYAAAFREAGIDVAALPPAEAGARINARPAAVAVVLASALDDWAVVRRDKRRDRPGADRLSQAARVADPDPWRNRLRDALDAAGGQERLGALRELARSARIDELPAVGLDLLGSALRDAGDPRAAEGVFRQAQRRHPGDVWLNYNLARCLEKLARRDEAIRYFTAARSIRPEVAHELAHALEQRGESDEALAIFQELSRLRPGNGRHLMCLSTNLQKRGRARESGAALDAAIAALREEIRKRPDDAWSRANLGRVLRRQGEPVEALAETREAVRLRPDEANYRVDLGDALVIQGRLEDAVTEYREGIRLQPDSVLACDHLADVLERQGKPEEAMAEYRTIIRLQPDAHQGHENLGRLLSSQRKRQEAIAEYRIAVRIDPSCHTARERLVQALRDEGKLDEAIGVFREAVRLQPANAYTHEQFGWYLYEQGMTAEAVAEYRDAIRLQPDKGSAHRGLAMALRRQGSLEEAITEYHAAFRLERDDAGFLNYTAWDLVRPPGRPRQEYEMGLMYARKAVELTPKDGYIVNSLALAEYRVGHWADSIAASERSLALVQGLEGVNWFFLAMAHWQKGGKSEARKWFDKAVAWTKEKDPNNAEVRPFWTEAAEVVGQPGPPAPVSPKAPAAAKPQ